MLWLLVAIVYLPVVPLFVYLFFEYVPRFEKMFNSLGGKLPFLSLLILTVSHWMISNVFLVIVACLGVALLCLLAPVRRSMWLPAIALLVGFTALALSVLVPLGIFGPIIMLQDALR